MPGGEDPDNRRDFPGGFPGDSQDAFSAQGRTSEQQGVYNCVHTLLQLRRDHPALRRGEQIYLASDAQTYAYVRKFAPDPGSVAGQAPELLLMVMNSAGVQRSIELDIRDTPIASASAVDPLIAAPPAELIGRSKLRVAVAARSLGIYLVK